MGEHWEDSFRECKVENDIRDVPKTLVAFANSLPPGEPGVLIIGEKDDGTIQGVSNIESTQRKVKEYIKKIYPPIIYQTRKFKKEGETLVEVKVFHSENGPHFEGPAWVRRANSSEPASEEIFQRLIDRRSSKTYLLQQHLGRQVQIRVDEGSIVSGIDSGTLLSPGISPGKQFAMAWAFFGVATLTDVNRFWLTVKNDDGESRSCPLEKVLLSYDENADQLVIVIIFSGFSST